MPSRILVVGSSNTDLVIYCDRLPRPGETVLGGEFQTFGGGKGANQAVAAARAGGNVTFVAARGADDFGKAARDRLAAEGIDLDYFQIAPGVPSGVALILVDGKTRDNLIAVAKSANDALDFTMVSAARPAFARADVVIAQLEIRDEVIEAVAGLCGELGKRWILNPAPTRPLSQPVLAAVHTIVVNEHEAKDYSGVADFDQAVRWFLGQGCKQVVVTLGSEGVIYAGAEGKGRIAAPRVQPVDTTGAGDCFVGWLGVGIADGLSLAEAAEQATRAASLKVTRAGAQAGMPYRAEVTGDG
ncbi:MAG: ribokinase [Verrucomicrobia bacterium]|nr:ribokinase [Verrucomicrobiota bacterium]